ncbi:hypothetical protein MAR_030453 [Mya arenaria]|uniref:Uncharacterized protein n=1 Tax=Mya arenaria TaxID=6604 RepID=A0ABY7F4X2_MYAAR|nr:hypothetical protein MAR_030453 [Mya arenaria]
MPTGGQSDDIATIKDTLKELSIKLKHGLAASIDGKISAQRDDLAMNISRESNRIDQVYTTIKSIQSPMDAIENQPVNTIDNEGAGGAGAEYRHRNLEDSGVCITVSGIVYQDGEELSAKANDLIKALGDNVHSRVRVTDATRLRSFVQGRPPLIKISFRYNEEKVLVLRNKYVLKDIVFYKQVLIKSTNSHAERLNVLNARTLLRQLPHGNNFRVDAIGCIRPRENNGRQNQPQPQDQQ